MWDLPPMCVPAPACVCVCSRVGTFGKCMDRWFLRCNSAFRHKLMGATLWRQVIISDQILSFYWKITQIVAAPANTEIRSYYLWSLERSALAVAQRELYQSSWTDGVARGFLSHLIAVRIVNNTQQEPNPAKACERTTKWRPIVSFRDGTGDWSEFCSSSPKSFSVPGLMPSVVSRVSHAAIKRFEPIISISNILIHFRT